MLQDASALTRNCKRTCEAARSSAVLSPCFYEPMRGPSSSRDEARRIAANIAKLPVIRSKRDGEHCKCNGGRDKPKACHHHDRDERVSGAKRQHNRFSTMRHLPNCP